MYKSHLPLALGFLAALNIKMITRMRTLVLLVELMFIVFFL